LRGTNPFSTASIDDRLQLSAWSGYAVIDREVFAFNEAALDAALRQPRKEGLEVRDENVAHHYPLGYEHINMLGRYAFSLPDRIARGKLRPLRNPSQLDEAA
jgi:hypothetical protein